MTPEYDVRLDDREYRVRIRKLDEGGLLVVSVGDETFTLKTAPGQEGVWTVSDQSSHHQVKIVRRMGRNVTVELDGEEKELEWGRVRTQESSSQKRSSSPGGTSSSAGRRAKVSSTGTPTRFSSPRPAILTALATEECASAEA